MLLVGQQFERETKQGQAEQALAHGLTLVAKPLKWNIEYGLKFQQAADPDIQKATLEEGHDARAVHRNQRELAPTQGKRKGIDLPSPRHSEQTTPCPQLLRTFTKSRENI